MMLLSFAGLVIALAQSFVVRVASSTVTDLDYFLKQFEGEKFPLSIDQIKGLYTGSIQPEDFIYDTSIQATDLGALNKPGQVKGTKDKKGKKKKRTKKPKKAGKKTTKFEKLDNATLTKLLKDRDKKREEEFGYNKTAEDQCNKGENFTHSCVYFYDPAQQYDKWRYTCECTKKSNKALFDEVDKNKDGIVTPEEYNKYYKDQGCKFPFKFKNYYSGNLVKYENCTLVDTDFTNHSWCSIKTDIYDVHVPSFYKYCDDEGMQKALNYLLMKYDTNKDGNFSFEEVAKYEKINALASSQKDCYNDCASPPVECMTPSFKSPKCLNYFKTLPLGDEELLRILADAQLEAYAPTNGIDKTSSYLTVPSMRDGAWLTKLSDSNYKRIDANDVSDGIYIACRWLLDASPTGVLSFFSFLAIDILLQNAIVSGAVYSFCGGMLITYHLKYPHLVDGKDAVQWSLLSITKGAHKNKKILAFMGTDFKENTEQLVLDLYGIPLARPMAKNLIEDATVIANSLKPDYVTGHSLGGFIAEGVSTNTGIPGASFAALGGMDPGGEASIFSDFKHVNRTFEVVLNRNDIALLIGAKEGFQCSHIAKSCDLRLLDFEEKVLGFLNTLAGHSSDNYAIETLRKYSIGWNKTVKESNATFLPGVKKNQLCDPCLHDSYCESGRCHENRCVTFDQKPHPTFCPLPNPLRKKGGEPMSRTPWDDKTPCRSNQDCVSGKCVNGKYCTETCTRDKDCKSTGRCEFGGQCQRKLESGEGCNEDSDCVSNMCKWAPSWYLWFNRECT